MKILLSRRAAATDLRQHLHTLQMGGGTHRADSGQLPAGAQQAVLQDVPLLHQVLHGCGVGAVLLAQLLTG